MLSKELLSDLIFANVKFGERPALVSENSSEIFLIKHKVKILRYRGSVLQGEIYFSSLFNLGRTQRIFGFIKEGIVTCQDTGEEKTVKGLH